MVIAPGPQFRYHMQHTEMRRRVNKCPKSGVENMRSAVALGMLVVLTD